MKNPKVELKNKCCGTDPSLLPVVEVVRNVEVIKEVPVVKEVEVEVVKDDIRDVIEGVPADVELLRQNPKIVNLISKSTETAQTPKIELMNKCCGTDHSPLPVVEV